MVLGTHHWPLHLLPDRVHPMSMHRMVLHLVGGSLHSMVMHAWFRHHSVLHQPCTSIVRCNVHVRMHCHPSMSMCHTTTHVHSRIHLLYTIRYHVHPHPLLGVAGHHRGSVGHHWPSDLHHAMLLGHHAVLLGHVHGHARHVRVGRRVPYTSTSSHKVHHLLLLGLHGIHL